MALVAVSGGVGLAIAARAVAARARPRAAARGVMAACALVAIAAPRQARVTGIAPAQAYQWRLSSDLADAVSAAGGRHAILRCGTPYVGALRGPLLAYHLRVRKRDVEPDLPPRPPGVVFRSALTVRHAIAPGTAPGFAVIARAGAWEVLTACRAAR
jgi:hypothetical protein